MKNKKIILIFGLPLILIIIVGFFTIKYISRIKNNQENEYIPQEEIGDEQLRQTIVSLYFLSNVENKLVPEARLVDIKEILNNPSERIMELLIEGPKNEKNKRIIPENTKILKTYMDGDCSVIDLSQDFLNYDKEDTVIKDNIIKSIVNTLTQLTEVNKVQILIDGEENEIFNEIYEK